MKLRPAGHASIAAGFAVLLATTTASAAPIFFADRTAFELAVGGGLTFESFEGDFPLLASQTFGSLTVSETNGVDVVAQARNYGFMAFVITHGTGAVWFDDNDNSVGHFAFATPINAFGVDIATDLATTVAVGGGVVSSITLAALTPSFFGVYDPTGSFNELTFTAEGGPNIGWDALSYKSAEPIPEPGSLLLLASGLGVLGFGRKRKGG
jgi:hypothetical protein